MSKLHIGGQVGVSKRDDVGDVNRAFLDNIEAAKKAKSKGTKFKYEWRDVILYNLGVGAKKTDLPLIFEGNDEFQALPTFGVIPSLSAEAPYNIGNLVPNFSLMMLLHGEQYLEIKQFPIPTAATLISYPELIEVVDKDSAAILKSGTTTVNAENGQPVFYNETTIFLRGCGGFGGQKKPSDRGAATMANQPPNRTPDVVVEDETIEEQAILYRLSGDYNPLHVDPAFAEVGGFQAPILHGLCSYGIVGKAVLQKYGLFKNIKVRFAGTVLPGETLVTEMWKEGNRVTFQTKVKETGMLAITSAAVELIGGSEKGKL